MLRPPDLCGGWVSSGGSESCKTRDETTFSKAKKLSILGGGVPILLFKIANGRTRRSK